MSIFEICDDSGLMALVNPDSYASFVNPDWEYNELLSHFRHEMAARNLLIWNTGLENDWRVKVFFERTPIVGFREISGTIISQSRLLITNYENLSMAAQFADVKLAAEDSGAAFFTVTPGPYDCRIIQLDDPKGSKPFNRPEGEPHFILELTSTVNPLSAWSSVPWSNF